VLESVAESDAPLYLAGEILPYPLGGRGVYRAYASADLAGIEALHDDTPLSLAYWIDRERGELSCAPPKPPTGFQELTSDRLGAAGMVALDTALSQTTPTLALAEAWLDDRIALYADASFKKLALAYRIRFATEADALALSERILANEQLDQARLSVSTEGSELLVLAANAPDLLAALVADEECALPEKARRSSPSLLAATQRWKTFRP
jgi:hypothetical protein